MKRHPHWLKTELGGGESYAKVKKNLKKYKLNTVCESAACPNLGECWNRGTATFMILGDLCTRNCRFCNVAKGSPGEPDPDEPENTALAAEALGLNYVVVTSVTRDDLDDGGARHFAETVKRIRKHLPDAGIETLIPDFMGKTESFRIILEEPPDVLNHNVETVPRLYPIVRPEADYSRSLNVLRFFYNHGLKVKSGLMLGMGESISEILEVFQDLHSTGCRMLTLGQYLQPSKKHLPLHRYVTPDEFDELKQKALNMGFRHVESGPLVRSSYHADLYGRSD